MEYRRLGRSDLEVSALSLGILSMVGGGTWGMQDQREAVRTITMACDSGINFFDTAESYAEGESERVLGQALTGRRSQVVIASKVSSDHLTPFDLIRACEGSLRRLGTDYLDLYYIHWPNPAIPLEETMGALTRLQEQGKIRVIGCSNFGHKDMEKLLRWGRVEANQLPYSLLWRAIEFDIIDYCLERDVSITCYSPLAQGLLTAKYASPDEVPDERARNRLFSCQRPHAEHGGTGAEVEVSAALARMRELCAGWGVTMTQASLHWILTQKGVGSVIVGCRTSEQLQKTLTAMDVSLPESALSELGVLTESIKQCIGPNPDMWSPEDSPRYDGYPE